LRSSFRPAHFNKSSLRTASQLRTVIDRFALKKNGIPRWGDQVTIYPYQRNGRQEDMIVDTRPTRRIGKRANQVKFGKQPNGTLFPVAMPPTSLQNQSSRVIDDYCQKGSIRDRILPEKSVKVMFQLKKTFRTLEISAIRF